MKPSDVIATSRSNAWWRFAPVLILLAVVYSYSNACSGPFIFDDRDAIPRNPNNHTLWPIWKTMFPNPAIGTAGRPLVAISYAINYAFDGDNPRGYHAGNVVFHALAALVLWGVLRRSLRRLAHPAAEPIALVATLIWAVHPLLTDSVTYIMDRTEVMMSLCILLTMYTFLRALDSRRRQAWMATSVMCSFCAVACKEVGAMTGPIMILFDVLLITGSWKQTWRERKAYHLLLLLGWPLLAGLLTTTALAVKTGGGDSGRITRWGYLLMQSQVILMYLKLCFWPSPLVLTYVDWPVPTSIFKVWAEMAAMIGLVVLSAVLVIRKKRAGIFGAWFFLILAPSSSLLPLPSEPVAERRMYLPLIAVVMIVLLALERVTRRLPRREGVGGLAAAALIVLLTQATLYRNDDFSSDLAIWSDTVLKRPNNPIAQYELGIVFANTGDPANALIQFQKAIEIAPGYPPPRIPHAAMLSVLGQNQQAYNELLQLLVTRPNDPEVMCAIGSVKYAMGDHAGAKAIWQSVLQKYPGYSDAQRMLSQAAATERATPSGAR